MNYFHGIIPCYYFLIKELLDTITGTKPNRLKNVLIALLTILTLVFILLVILPFHIFKKLVEIYLIVKHGKRFGGILPAVDAMYESCTPKVTMNVIYIVTHNGNEIQLYDDVKKMCKRLHESHFKFSSMVESFLGYRYYLKNKIDINNVVSKFKCNEDEYVTKENFIKCLDNFYDRKPSDRRLWDVNICTQRLLWNEKSYINPHYALVIRTNHSVSDAYSLCIFHQTYLANEIVGLDIDEGKISKAVEAGKRHNFGKINVHKVVFSNPSDFSLSIPYSQAGQFYAFMNEEQVKYLPVLKKLKTKYGTTINDILATAASHSIFRYFEKEHLSADDITCVMTCRSLTENVKLLLSGELFGNEATGIVASLPKMGKNIRFANRLKEIADICKRTRISMDRQLIHTNIKLGNSLPSVVGEYFFQCNASSLAISNVPLPNIKTLGGMEIQDIFGFVNQFANIKFVLVVVSFNDRLHVSLTAKRGIVQTREDLQNILDDIFLFVDNLAQEDDTMSPEFVEEMFSQGL